MTDSETGAQPVAPTVLLYQTDSYVREFDARVVAVEGSAVALEQTAFFPGGGGQMADRGTLTIAGQAYPIMALRKSGDVIWHELDLGGHDAPAVGAEVHGALDWDFRYQMMRTHTALHSSDGGDLPRLRRTGDGRADVSRPRAHGLRVRGLQGRDGA